MSFEESMIEDGYHDEEEYIEHLMDEAENEWGSQRNMESSYREEYEDNDYCDEDDEDYYEDLSKQYQQWAKENKLKHSLFYVWAYFDTEKDSDSNYDNFILDKFEEWQRDESWQTERMKDYYGDDYPRILNYLKWKVENPIEERLRQPDDIDYFYPIDTYPYMQEIPPRDLLIEEVNEFEEWLNRKKRYEKWFSSASEKEKKAFLNDVNESDFQGDVSIEHVRDCMLKQLEAENTWDLIVKKILSWLMKTRKEVGNYST